MNTDSLKPLPNGNDRHPEAERPLHDVSSALESAASQVAPNLDPTLKAQQREMLISRAQAAMHPSTPMATPTPVIVPPAPKKEEPKAKQSRPWFAMLGGLATVAAAVVLAVFVAPRFLNQSGNTLAPAASSLLGRLAIPEAHAGDAFQVYAEKYDTAGTSLDSSFIVKSNVDVSAETLKQSLQIVPPVATEIQKTDANTFRVTPAKALDSGAVYRVAIATDIQHDDGSIQARDFSWAFQTKNEFRVYSSVPGDGSSSVPVNTGLEFNLSNEGFAAPSADKFTITPVVDGKFEVKGRTLIFIPSKPLQPGTSYQATLKAGFGLTGSDAVLPQDYKIRFETGVPSPTTEQPVTVEVNDFQEYQPNKPIEIEVPNWDDRLTGKNIEVTGYALSVEQATSLLKEHFSQASWKQFARSQFNDFKKLNLTNAAFSVKTTLVKKDTGDSYSKLYTLNLPAQSNNGAFAVRFMPEGGKETWAFIQVTNVGNTLLADKQTLLLWALNVDTKKPMSGVPVTIDGKPFNTDDMGLARLPTPAFLSATNTDPNDHLELSIITIGSGANTTFTFVREQAMYRPFMWGDGGGFNINDTWVYSYLDRALYHPSDELNFFVFAQDRTNKQSVGQVTASVRRQEWWFDYGFGDANRKVYQSMDVSLDGSGVGQGKFAWQNYAPGYYTLEIKRGNTLIATKSFEIREFVKPAYQISVDIQDKNVFSGSSVRGTVETSFFDGTPVPRVDLNIGSSGYEASSAGTQAKTNEQGTANFTVSSTSANCTGWYCGPQSLILQATPASGEEGDISGSDSTTIYPSQAIIRSYPKTSGLNASIDIRTFKVNLAKDIDKQDEIWANRRVTVTAQAVHWERVEDGFYYDYYLKQLQKRYRYEEKRDTPKVDALMTDASGKVTWNFAMQQDRYYDVTIASLDDQSRNTFQRFSMAPGWYDNVTYTYDPADPMNVQTGFGSPDENPKLDFVPSNSLGQFTLNEQVNVRFEIGSRPLNINSESPALFVVASRGIKNAAVVSGSDYIFPFNEGLVPNAEIRAIAYINGQFQTVRLSASMKTVDKELEVTAQTDKPSYKPGDEVTVNLQVKSKASGAPVANAKVGYSAVDKALLALTGDYKANPITDLYQYVGDGILYEGSSFQDRLALMSGGAEKGGGGGDAGRLGIRSNFKDVSAFGIVQTDGNGQASVRFKVPDNLTSWRMEMVGLTPTLKTGAGRVDVVVSKPVFVEAVVPPRLLQTDKPVIKLRAYGQGLTAQTPVTFVLESPTLGINQRVEGKAEQVTYLGIDKLALGTHQLTARVEAQAGNDGVVRPITVVDSRFTKQAYEDQDLTPGLSLKSLGTAETDLLFTNKGRASLLSELWNLNWYPTARVDGAVAHRIATDLLKSNFDVEPGDETQEPLNAFQGPSGGITLMTYSSPDTALTSEMAATAPQYFDREGMRGYLLNVLSRKDLNREEQIQALSGLVAVGDPSLLRLKGFLAQKDLNLTEKIAIMRGLVAGGDLEAARGMLDSVLTGAVETDGRMVIKTKGQDDLSATADAAALAAAVADARANKLMATVSNTWDSDAFPLLARTRYVQTVLPRLPKHDITIKYTLDGSQEQTMLMKADEVSKSLTLTAAEASNFRITSVDGPASVSYVRRTPGKPAAKSAFTISRNYTADHPLNELMDGDQVTVTLKPTWSANAKKGCYNVVDSLPGNLQPVLNRMGPMWSDSYYISSSENGHVSFVACTSDTQKDISYKARIVTRGTYTAEAPLMQNMETPSVATVGVDQAFSTK